MNETIKWLDTVRGSDSIREVARRIGTTHATLNRQANDDSLSFELVRSISYAYNRPVLADLLATGHLAEKDLGVDSIENALHSATDEQLVLEVARRLDATDIGAIYDKPISEAVADSNVKQFPTRNVPDSVETPQRRVAKKKSRDRGGDEGQG